MSGKTIHYVTPGKNQLLVGTTLNGREVSITHPDIDPDKDGIGYITFSPGQARNLASLLCKHASAIEASERAARKRAKPEPKRPG